MIYSCAILLLCSVAAVSCATALMDPMVHGANVDGRAKSLCSATYPEGESRTLCLRWFGWQPPAHTGPPPPPGWPSVSRGCAWHALQTQGVHSTPARTFGYCVARVWYDPSPHPEIPVLVPPARPAHDKAECAAAAAEAVQSYEQCMLSEGWPETRTGVSAGGELKRPWRRDAARCQRTAGFPASDFGFIGAFRSCLSSRGWKQRTHDGRVVELL